LVDGSCQRHAPTSIADADVRHSLREIVQQALTVKYLACRYFVSNLPIQGSAEAVPSFRRTEHIAAFRAGMERPSACGRSALSNGQPDPDLLVMLNEYNGIYRQVFMDARPLPKNPNPSWQGYSSAQWSRDTLEIDSVGFRDDLWIDWDGSVITEAAKVRERIRRPDFGHLEIEITVDDPKAYTKPWTVTVHQQFAADTELIDEICAEGERFSKTLR
jgi:hypothetical protein